MKQLAVGPRMRRVVIGGVLVSGVLGLLGPAPRTQAANRNPFPAELRLGHPSAGRQAQGQVSKAARLAAQYAAMRQAKQWDISARGQLALTQER